jgi:hypothetical protein
MVDVLPGDPGKFGGGGDPVLTPKDNENKDGMLARPDQSLPAGASTGGTTVKGDRLGR